MHVEEKVKLNRMRRKAARQGLRLEGSARKDPDAAEFRKYRLLDEATGTVVAGGDDRWTYTLSIDEVEEILTGKGKGART